MGAVQDWIKSHRAAWTISTTLAFLAAAALDLTLSRHGVRTSTLWVFSAVLVVVGALWAFTLPSAVGRGWVLAGAVVTGLLANTYLIALVAVGSPSASSVVGNLAAHQHVFGLLTLIALYLTLSGFLTRCRQHQHLGWFGAGSIAAGTAAVLVGGAFVAAKDGRGSIVVALGLSLVGFLVIVIGGFNLGGTWLIRKIQSTSLWPLGILYVLMLGALTTVAGLAIVAAQTHSLGVCLIALAVVGLVMACVVSNAPFETVLVVVLLVALGITQPESKPAPVSAPQAGDTVLLSLGDSYMSGEGARAFYPGTDEGGADECRRAPTAWAAKAVYSSHDFDRLEFLACSGAQTYNIDGVNGGYDVQRGEPGTQLEQYVSLVKEKGLDQVRPSLVVLSIAGNDANFATIGATCFAPGDCSQKAALFEGALPQVEARLESTYASIKAALPAGTPILVVPYPNPIYKDPTTGKVPSRCDVQRLSTKERTFVSSFVGLLDDEIQTAAANQGLYFLDAMESAFTASHLQLCDPKAPLVKHCPAGTNSEYGVNVLNLYSVQGSFSRRYNPKNWVHSSLHPNECGHSAMLDVFNAWLPSFRAATVKPPTAPATPTLPPLRCTLAADQPGANDCDTQAFTWVAQQARAAAGPIITAILLLVLGSGLLSIAALARLERRLSKAPNRLHPERNRY